jgi:hypothetical protein
MLITGPLAGNFLYNGIKACDQEVERGWDGKVQFGA